MREVAAERFGSSVIVSSRGIPDLAMPRFDAN
jgi:hypothetical protein